MASFLLKSNGNDMKQLYIKHQKKESFLKSMFVCMYGIRLCNIIYRGEQRTCPSYRVVALFPLIFDLKRMQTN